MQQDGEWVQLPLLKSKVKPSVHEVNEVSAKQMSRMIRKKQIEGAYVGHSLPGSNETHEGDRDSAKIKLHNRQGHHKIYWSLHCDLVGPFQGKACPNCSTVNVP